MKPKQAPQKPEEIVLDVQNSGAGQKTNTPPGEGEEKEKR